MEERTMPKYLLAYHGGGGMPETEAEQAAVMQAWEAWFTDLGSAVVDGGNPIAQTRTVGPGGGVSDGGGPSPLSGYSLITADDLDAAVKLAAGCPVVDGGGSVEVAETIDM
jgi:hypothetical protein